MNWTTIPGIPAHKELCRFCFVFLCFVIQIQCFGFASWSRGHFSFVPKVVGVYFVNCCWTRDWGFYFLLILGSVPLHRIWVGARYGDGSISLNIFTGDRWFQSISSLFTPLVCTNMITHVLHGRVCLFCLRPLCFFLFTMQKYTLSLLSLNFPLLFFDFLSLGKSAAAVIRSLVSVLFGSAHARATDLKGIWFQGGWRWKL